MTSKQPYSLAQVVTDGPLTAPRWVHHLVKITTHALVALFFVVVLRASLIEATVFGGPILWLVLALHEHFWPTDTQPLTDWQHFADWMNDCALSAVPLACVLQVRHEVTGAGLLWGAIFGAYSACHRNARP